MRTLLFDLHGTLIENGVYPSPLKQVRYFLRLHMQYSDFVKKFEDVMMRQAFPTLKDAFLEVAKAFDMELSEFQFEKLIGMWNKNKLLARPFPETIQALKELRSRGYKLVILSNCDCFTKEIVEKYQLEKYVDGIFLSCDTGMLKHEPAFFEHVLNQVKAKKEDAVMVGDSIESDMRSAELAGIQGILIDRKDSRKYTPSIRSLHELEEKLMGLNSE
ncbi:MAG: HAD family hydrolase [archaeon]